MSAPTRDDWLKALKEVESQDDPDAFTLKELGEMWGRGRASTSNIIAKLVNAGRAKEIEVVRWTPAGRKIMARAYKLLS